MFFNMFSIPTIQLLMDLKDIKFTYNANRNVIAHATAKWFLVLVFPFKCFKVSLFL